MFHNIIGVFWSFAVLHNTVYCNNRTRLGVDYRYRNSFFGVCVVRALFFGLLLGMEICYCIVLLQPRMTIGLSLPYGMV